MKRLQHVRTRRQLFRVTAVTAASIPFLALTRNSLSSMGRLPPDPPPHPHQHYSCLLKGTKISTPSGDRLVQDLQIGDEVQTLAGSKTIKWIGSNKFNKKRAKAWQDSGMAVHVARFAIDDQQP